MKNTVAQIAAEIGSSSIRDTATLQLLRSIVSNSDKLGLSWSMRPGTTVEPDPTDGSTRVIIDGSTTAIPIMSFIGQVPAGARVMVLISPPAGHHIIGCVDATAGEWYQPTLLNGWHNMAGHQPMSFRLLANPPRSVQVVGALDPGTIGWSVLLAQVPEYFWPKSTAAFGCGGRIYYERTPHIEVTTTGDVWLYHSNNDEYTFVNAMYPLDL